MSRRRSAASHGATYGFATSGTIAARFALSIFARSMGQSKGTAARTESVSGVALFSSTLIALVKKPNYDTTHESSAEPAQTLYPLDR
jgi:hypothetical protein